MRGAELTGNGDLEQNGIDNSVDSEILHFGLDGLSLGQLLTNRLRMNPLDIADRLTAVENLDRIRIPLIPGFAFKLKLGTRGDIP